MERGPMALFGAIVAVGLGPAMWLGAQFGNATYVPTSPPAVSSEHKPQQNQDKGGAAGSAPQDPTVILNTDPQADIRPLNQETPRALPSASHTKSHGQPSAEPSATSATPAPTDDPGTPPTKSTDPADPPSGGGGDGGPIDPSPPADGGGSSGSGSGTNIGT